MTNKPILPIHDLLLQAVDDGSDYNDGDDPGWYGHNWNPDTGLLAIRYVADDDVAGHTSTIAVFKFQGAGPDLGAR